jgi:FkbM family methyltransferase
MWFNWLNKNLIHFLPKRIHIDGVNFYFNRLDRAVALLCWKYGIIEKQELRTVLSHIHEDTIFLDIGANMGIYSFRASKKIRTGKIISFEPDKNHFECLLKTRDKNKISNVFLHPLAVTNENGSISFHNQSMNGGDFRINYSQSGELVDTVKLDDFLGAGHKVDVVKMDIQGAECLALLGMQNIILDNPDLLIFCEYWPKGMRLLNIQPDTFISFIEKMKLNMYLIGAELTPISLIEFERLHQKGYTNILLTRKPLK